MARRGGRGAPATPLAARTQGRVVSRQEMLEEAVFQPQQNLDADGRTHRLRGQLCVVPSSFGTIGTDHGVAGLNLSNSPLRSAKYSLLEAIMFPNRKIAPEHETTSIVTSDGQHDSRARVARSGPSVSVLTREGTTTDVQKAQIKSRQKEKTSLMTEAMADTMNQTQWRNLLAFLTAAPPKGARAGDRRGVPYPSPLYQIPIAANLARSWTASIRVATDCVCEVLPPAAAANPPNTDRMIRLRLCGGRGAG